MTIHVDPEGNEISTLLELTNFKGKNVLEIGSGDGRLTWRFAGMAQHVTGIEPYVASVEKARRDLPQELIGRVEFEAIDFSEFVVTAHPRSYDCVLLSWALC